MSGFVHPSALLGELGGEARKRFGQHFLASPGVVSGIVRVARVGQGTRVLEIGPGLGVMTGPLLEAGAELVAVELDRDLAAFLAQRHPTLRLVQADAIKVDWRELLEGEGWVVAANLPYNVGTRILTQLLDCPDRFVRLVLMLQKEVAERLVAPAGDRKRGSLSVYVQARASARIALYVPPGSFYPPPKVESAVVELTLGSPPEVEGLDLDQLETVVRAGFTQPRKMLRRTVGTCFGMEAAAAALEEAGIDPTARPGTLELASWAALTRALAAQGALQESDKIG